LTSSQGSIVVATGNNFTEGAKEAKSEQTLVPGELVTHLEITVNWRAVILFLRSLRPSV
jgi:hypothetical protein